MHIIDRRLLLSLLAFSFAALTLPAFGQRVIATVPVGRGPLSAAVNSGTNKIYVADWCGNDPNCTSGGTVTVIDGATDNTLSVNVGYYPFGVAVNSVTNKIYVANWCGNDPSCASGGTLSVIDGVSNTVIATLITGSRPYSVAVNSVTNQIYVPNNCGHDVSCHTHSGTVTVIDGVSNTVTATVTVGSGPDQAVVNSITNKIYVANSCGNDPTCTYPYSGGTVTVIDGVTNNPTTVDVGIHPDALDVNSVTNKIYVANQCGDDPNCGSSTMTVIDGATLATTDVAIGGRDANTIAVNSVANKIYIPANCYGNPSCQGAPDGTVSVVDGVTLAYTSVGAGVSPDSMAVNSVANRIYVANECGSDRDPNCPSNGTVTVIDGTTLTFTNISVGHHPYGLALNSTTNRIYVPNYYDNTVSVMDGTPLVALQFVPLSQPCRAVDTRPPNGGDGPIQGGTSQNFAISGAGSCPALPSAAVYSMNVTVVPNGSLGYLTVWPAGEPQPLASLLNSLDGRVKANAAIIPAGDNGEISVYVTDTTNVVVDVNGYFAPASLSTLAFYPLAPCRVADTRHSGYPQGLGPPSLLGGQQRDFPILNATATCNIPPSGVAAYSLNLTVVPHRSLGYLTAWPTGQDRPTVSTLNDVPGRIIANAAIVVAGSGGDVSVYPTDDTDLVVDIDGYFAAAGQGGLSLYGVQPCRVIDTRHLGNGQPFRGTLSPPVDVVDSPCSVPSSAQAYVFNATVIPPGSFGYLTLWPDGIDQPLVSTLNAVDGSISSNMAIVPTNNGQVNAFASDLTQLLLDVSSYFAP
jgi:YVTN family beta-propeller protein